MAVEQGLHVKVIEIPEGKGKDPDECLKKNPDVWFRAVDGASPVMNWYFSRAFAGKDISNPRNKQAVVDVLLPEVSRIPYAVERDHWLQELAARVGVDVAILREDILRVSKSQEPRTRTPSTSNTSATVTQTVQRVVSRAEQLFGQFLMAMLHAGDIRALGQVDERLFAPVAQFAQYPLYEQLRLQYTGGHTLDVDALRQFFASQTGENPVDLMLMKASLEFSDIEKKQVEREAGEMLRGLHDILRKEQLRALETALKQAEAEHDTARMEEIVARVQALHTIR